MGVTEIEGVMTKNKIETLEQIKARLTKEAVAKAEASASAEAEKLWAEHNKATRSKIEALIKELDAGDEYGLIKVIHSVYDLAEWPSKKKKKKTEGKRHRTTITPEIEAQIKALHKAGKKGPAIAKELGLSYPTVLKRLK